MNIEKAYESWSESGDLATFDGLNESDWEAFFEQRGAEIIASASDGDEALADAMLLIELDQARRQQALKDASPKALRHALISAIHMHRGLLEDVGRQFRGISISFGLSISIGPLGASIGLSLSL